MISEFFDDAVTDYLYLLNRNYPYKPVLKIIGDRYRLTGRERSILLRGINKSENAESRKLKLLEEKNIADEILAVDGYNVLITIESYISGKFVYLSNDGLLRDAAESHGKNSNKKNLERSLNLLLDYLLILNPGKVVFFLDSPVSYSKLFLSRINASLDKKGIPGEAFIVKSADHELINYNQGICATGDSIIINKIDRVFDLAYNVIKYHFKPDFFSLEKYI